MQGLGKRGPGQMKSGGPGQMEDMLLGKCRVWEIEGFGKWRTWGNGWPGEMQDLGKRGPGGMEGWKMEDLGIEGAREMKILEK